MSRRAVRVDRDVSMLSARVMLRARVRCIGGFGWRTSAGRIRPRRCRSSSPLNREGRFRVWAPLLAVREGARGGAAGCDPGVARRDG